MSTETVRGATNALQSHAEAVAREVLPDAMEEGERGIDFITIVTMIISIVQTLVQNCPMPARQVKDGFKRPSLRQRAAVLKVTKEHCDCMGLARHTGRIYQALLARGGSLTDPDAEAVITEAVDDRNLLI